MEQHIISGIDELRFRIEKLSAGSVFVLVDEHTREYCLPLLEGVTDPVENVYILEIQSGEAQKTIYSCEKIWTELSEKGADRKSLLINLGGGVICDIGGFAGSTFKRGMRYINIPTTLLAMADAAIGGKCGVDLAGLKNEVGLFGKPEFIFIHSDFLKTLPDRELLSGFAEVVKIALTSSAGFWKKLINLNPTEITGWKSIIDEAVNLKQSITDLDPFESGPRKLLNFGHTIGHAVESQFLSEGKLILHGEAIAFGLIAEARLSTLYSGLSDTEYAAIENYVKLTFNIPEILPEQVSGILDFMKHDKKNVNGQMNFTLLKQIGEGCWDIKVREEELFQII